MVWSPVLARQATTTKQQQEKYNYHVPQTDTIQAKQKHIKPLLLQSYEITF